MISRRRNGPFGRTRVTPSAFLIGPATAGTSILIGSLERTSHIGGGRGGGKKFKNFFCLRGSAALFIWFGSWAASHPMGPLLFFSGLTLWKIMLSSLTSPDTI